jgi:DNA-binding XRE family transcriptional regulator
LFPYNGSQNQACSNVENGFKNECNNASLELKLNAEIKLKVSLCRYLSWQFKAVFHATGCYCYRHWTFFNFVNLDHLHRLFKFDYSTDDYGLELYLSVKQQGVFSKSTIFNLGHSHVHCHSYRWSLLFTEGLHNYRHVTYTVNLMYNQVGLLSPAM